MKGASKHENKQEIELADCPDKPVISSQEKFRTLETVIDILDEYEVAPSVV